MVFVHGGSYNSNNASSYNPIPLITAGENAFLAVVVQYRLGSFGFLQSPEIAAGGGSNLAITDARFALEWVQRYIPKFGGDPSRVTVRLLCLALSRREVDSSRDEQVWGQSAGGCTALSIAAAEYGQGSCLFKSVVVNSPWAPAVADCSSSYFVVSSFLAVILDARL